MLDEVDAFIRKLAAIDNNAEVIAFYAKLADAGTAISALEARIIEVHGGINGIDQELAMLNRTFRLAIEALTPELFGLIRVDALTAMLEAVSKPHH